MPRRTNVCNKPGKDRCVGNIGRDRSEREPIVDGTGSQPIEPVGQGSRGQARNGPTGDTVAAQEVQSMSEEPDCRRNNEKRGNESGRQRHRSEGQVGVPGEADQRGVFQRMEGEVLAAEVDGDNECPDTNGPPHTERNAASYRNPEGAATATKVATAAPRMAMRNKWIFMETLHTVLRVPEHPDKAPLAYLMGFLGHTTTQLSRHRLRSRPVRLSRLSNRTLRERAEGRSKTRSKQTRRLTEEGSFTGSHCESLPRLALALLVEQTN
jgi:hypothetical protein